MCSRLALTGLCAIFASGVLPAKALEIIPDFDTTITSAADAADIESGINFAVSTLNSLYSNPTTINVLFTSAASNTFAGLTLVGLVDVTYQQYGALLQNNSANNPNNLVLATATNHLHDGNGANPKDVLLTTANARALGMNVTGRYDATGAYQAGGAKYDAVIELNPNFSMTSTAWPQPPGVTVTEHELNEALGGGGIGSMLDRPGGFDNNYYGSLDPYRYAYVSGSAGTAAMGSFDNTTQDSLAYMSVDGGKNLIWYFNNDPVGGDLGDWAALGPSDCIIQSAVVCDDTETYNNITSPEFFMMNAIGYDPNGPEVPYLYPALSQSATPVPATWLLMSSGLAGFGLLARRARKNSRIALAV